MRFAGGVIIGSDSQASDPVHKVRWPVSKARQVRNQPLVIGFSGSLGVAERARESLDNANFQRNVFNKRDLVRTRIRKAFEPHLEEVKRDVESMSIENLARRALTDYHPPVLTALAAFLTRGEAQIMEFEWNGETSFHDTGFRAIGSGTGTAQAAWLTLGGERLVDLNEEGATHAMLRILRTTVAVDERGVSGPFSMFVLSGEQVRELDPDIHVQAVEQWEREQVEDLLAWGSSPS